MCDQGSTQEAVIDGKSISVDSCIAKDVTSINRRFKGTLRTAGCCCGHGKYPPTIVVKELNTGTHREFFTGVEITRRRNLYYKDDEGVFHLPEVKKILTKPDTADHDEDRI